MECVVVDRRRNVLRTPITQHDVGTRAVETVDSNAMAVGAVDQARPGILIRTGCTGSREPVLAVQRIGPTTARIAAPRNPNVLPPQLVLARDFPKQERVGRPVGDARHADDRSIV